MKTRRNLFIFAILGGVVVRLLPLITFGGEIPFAAGGVYQEAAYQIYRCFPDFPKALPGRNL